MLFREEPAPPLAISQMTHAWISGQLLRAWSEPLDEAVLLAAAQHDIAWLDWETAPSFDAGRGRPHCFRDIGAATHAPMWRRGVERACAAWGTHVALLVSRHGGVIYRRYTKRHQGGADAADAAAAFLAAQAPTEADWARALGLDHATLDRQTALVAFADTLSLALCGALDAPLDLAFPDAGGVMRQARLRHGDGPHCLTLSPWPFAQAAVTVGGQARELPPGGRLVDEAAMRDWLGSSTRTGFKGRLCRY